MNREALNTSLEIPPQPLKPAVVAAPKARRRATNGQRVRTAEAALLTRKSARTSRGGVTASCATSTRADCSAIGSADCRSAAAQDHGETAPTRAVAASDDAHGNIAAGTKSMDEGRASRSAKGRQKNRKAYADAAPPRQKTSPGQKP
jgi:hypothetical protein